MVYIGRDGTIANARPWSLDRVKDLIKGFFQAVYLFFMTLVGDLLPGSGSGSNDRTTRSTGRGSGGGGGGGGPPNGGTGRGQPAGFGRRIGRVVNMDDCNIPGGG